MLREHKNLRNEKGETMMMKIKRASGGGRMENGKCFVCAPAEEHGIIGKRRERLLNFS
jgi:hypothetical protein